MDEPVLGGLDGTGLESFDSAVADNPYDDRFDGTVLDIIIQTLKCRTTQIDRNNCRWGEKERQKRGHTGNSVDRK